MLTYPSRYVSVPWFIIQALQLQPIKSTQQSSCSIGSSMIKYAKRKEKTRLKTRPPLIKLWLTEVHVC